MCSYLASGISPCAARVPAVLQRHSDTSRVGQRLTAHEVCPRGRSHSAAADPRRIAPSLYPDLISDSDNADPREFRECRVGDLAAVARAWTKQLRAAGGQLKRTGA